MLILAAGGLLVLALVVWALTRTVEPASVMAPEGSVADATTGAPALGDTGFSTTASTTPTPTGTVPNVPTTPAPAGDAAEVRRIAVEDLRAKNDRGEVTVVDVRDAASFAQEHIPGAINIPFASIEGQADMIPKGKPIVTYCT